MQEGSAYLLLFLLPFSKAAIEILFVVWWAAWLVGLWAPDAERTRWLTAERRPLLLALAGYLAVCGLSVLWSSHPSKSLDGFIGKWSEYLWLFVIAVDLGARPGVLPRVAQVIATSSMFVMMEILTQQWFGKGILRSYPIEMYGRATGPYENPIDLATYFMVTLPLIVAWSWHARGLRAMVRGVLSSFVFICLARTGAMGAWLSLGAASTILLLWSMRMRRAMVAGLVAAGVVVLIGLGWAGGLDRVFSAQELGARDRWVMWQAGTGMVRSRPWLGHGVNTFMANYLDYWVGGEQQPRYAHNCYLQVAAETGLIGLAAFLMVLGTMFRRVLAELGRAPATQGGLVLGAAVGLVAFAMQAAIDTNFYALRQAALFWVLAGLLVGCREQERSA